MAVTVDETLTSLKNLLLQEFPALNDGVERRCEVSAPESVDHRHIRLSQSMEGRPIIFPAVWLWNRGAVQPRQINGERSP